MRNMLDGDLSLAAKQGGFFLQPEKSPNQMRPEICSLGGAEEKPSHPPDLIFDSARNHRLSSRGFQQKSSLAERT
jgi:hypothetical protein